MKEEFEKLTTLEEYMNAQGYLHKEDGPSVECSNGDKYWFFNGLRHREDGPAIELNNGYKEWWLNDTEYSEQEWEQKVTELKLKRILDL